MSWSFRRAALVLVCVASLGGLAFLQQALAQGRRALGGPAVPPPVAPGEAPGGPGAPGDGPPTAPGPSDKFDFAGLTLPRDNRLTKQVEAAHDYINEKDWETTINILQQLIDHPQDVFAELEKPGPEGKPVKVWVSVKKEANRLLASLPQPGIEAYEVKHGAAAKEMYEKARDNGDRRLMGQVMSRFLYTEAGGQAAEWLATQMLDRGDYVGAARYFKMLIQRGGAEKVAPKTLFKAAYAFHQAGDEDGEALAWKQLRADTSELNLGGRTESLADLKDYLDTLVRTDAERSIHDSPFYRGNAERNGQGFGGTAFLVPQWEHPKDLLDPEGGPKVPDKPEPDGGSAAAWVKQARERLEGLNQPVMSSFFPVTVTVAKGDEKVPLLVYRSYFGIYAVHVKTGELRWRTPSQWALGKMLHTDDEKGGFVDARKRQAITQWLTTYFNGNQRPGIVFENSTAGTLSADDQFVYAVDDLAVPPPFVQVNPWGGGGVVHNHGPELNKAIGRNVLQAFSLKRDGALSWQLGDDEDKGPTAESFFLGPPLPIDGKLYVLNEKQQELRLLCLDPAEGGKVVSAQTLATTKYKMEQDIGRRIRAAHLSYGEGILVVPTNTGAVFGVDLLSGSLVWAYPYRESTDVDPGMTTPPGFPGGLPPGAMVPGGGMIQPMQSLQSQWMVSAPVIQDGKVIFTAPDAKSIHCINLRDGTPVWTRSRNEDDLYLAGVFKNTVLIVGKSSCTGLNAADGKLKFKLDTGLPSGQGVASDNIYYLPLASAARTKEPEICAIDVAAEQIVAHTRSRKKDTIPGNLLFYQGDVLSQTIDEIVAYPQLQVKLTQMDALLKKNPNDPVGLTERGELRLDKGELAGAVADLRSALRNDPPEKTKEKARLKLYEAFTEFFQRDFGEAKKYTSEYEELCNVPGNEPEERRRKSNFLALVAKGREKEGDLVEAFERYRQFVEVAGTKELISVVDEPAVKAAPDVWSQGRIAAMVANADEAGRKPLEELIGRKWEELRASGKGSTDDLRNFVKTFGSLFGVGKEARLALAERLMEESLDSGALLEAEQQLSLLRGPGEEPEVAARAVETLARLNMRKGLLEDAAYFYRLLGTRYGSVKVRDGMTGEDLLNHMYTDPRLLPHLDSPGQLGSGKDVSAADETGNFPVRANTYQFPQEGEPLPFFDRYRLSLRFDYHQLKVTDVRTEEERMSKTLTATQFQQMLYANGQGHLVRFAFQNIGHLVVLPVGHMVFGVDPVKGDVLWEKNLLGSLDRPGLNGFNYNNLTVDPRDGSVQVYYPDGWVQRLGQTGRLGGAVVCLQTRDALEALDPLTGRTLWQRTDVNPRSHIFSDEEHVYVVEVGSDGQPSVGRVFRAYDGVTVNVNDFAPAFANRLRLVGRRLLLSDTDADGKVNLRMYDILEGKDVWKTTFPAKSIVLQSEDTDLVGVLEPDGQLSVMDVREQKPLAKVTVKAEHMQNLQSAHLLFDGRYVFAALNGQPDANIARWGGVQSTLQPNAGLRALPIHGTVYCWELSTGRLRWFNPADNQMLILTRFQELPIVLFASRYNEPIQGGRFGTTQVVAVKAVEKRNGKHVYDSKLTGGNFMFHELNVDVRGGQIEFVSYNRKIKFYLGRAGKEGLPAGASSSAAPTPPIDPAVPGLGGPRIRAVEVVPARVIRRP